MLCVLRAEIQLWILFKIMSLLHFPSSMKTVLFSWLPLQRNRLTITYDSAVVNSICSCKCKNFFNDSIYFLVVCNVTFGKIMYVVQASSKINYLKR